MGNSQQTEAGKPIAKSGTKRPSRVTTTGDSTPGTPVKTSSSQGVQSSGGASAAASGSSPTTPASPSTTEAKPTVKWAWEGDMKGGSMFVDYDEETCGILERAFASGATSIELKHGFFGKQGGYKIDFKEMTQTKISTNFVRAIQRTSIDPGTKAQSVKTRPNPAANTPKGVKLNEKGLIQVTEEDVQRLIDPNAAGFSKPPESKKELIQRLTKYTSASPSEHECAICLCTLDEDVVELGQCKHQFHEDCIIHAGDPKGFLKCPSCGTLYGIKIGAMPKGTMRIDFHPRGQIPLSGYENDGTIQIMYSFPRGTQGPDHPVPGASYSGTSRTAYLPDNEEGREILALLETAFVRKLTFRIGTSVTTGEQNAVVWNGIHHKTSTSGGITSWGYPDATYFSRVKDELAALGITKESLVPNEVVPTSTSARNRLIQVS